MKRVIVLVLLLSGCQANIPTEQAPPVVVLVPVVPKAKPAVAPIVKPRFVVATIMGLAPETMENILGKAALIRKEKNVRVWLYENSQCRLHLYFYLNDNGDFRLDYVETTAADMSSENPTVSPNACLDSFVTSNSPPSSAGSNTGLQPDRSGN